MEEAVQAVGEPGDAEGGEMKGMERMVRALKDGWGFRYFKVTPMLTSRHSLWVTNDETDGWWVVKVDGGIPERDCLDALMDEAGVPR